MRFKRHRRARAINPFRFLLRFHPRQCQTCGDTGRVMVEQVFETGYSRTVWAICPRVRLFMMGAGHVTLAEPQLQPVANDMA